MKIIIVKFMVHFNTTTHYSLIIIICLYSMECLKCIGFALIFVFFFFMYILNNYSMIIKNLIYNMIDSIYVKLNN